MTQLSLSSLIVHTDGADEIQQLSSNRCLRVSLPESHAKKTCGKPWATFIVVAEYDSHGHVAMTAHIMGLRVAMTSYLKKRLVAMIAHIKTWRDDALAPRLVGKIVMMAHVLKPKFSIPSCRVNVVMSSFWIVHGECRRCHAS